MAGSKHPNHGRRGQRAHPTMTKKKRTEEARRHHYDSDVENEMDKEESSLENSRTSKDGQRTKQMSKVKWASKEEDSDSVGEYQVHTNGNECTLEEELVAARKGYNTLLSHCGNFKREIQEL
jgi:hypothetical protein